MGHHVTDEELLLDYYDESSPDDRAKRRAHVEMCEACRTLDREMRAVLAMVDAAPSIDAPPGFGREMWARIEPEIVARTTTRRSRWWPALSERRWPTRVEWAVAGGLAAIVVASFTLGRVWDHAPHQQKPPTSIDASALSERMLRTEVEDHFERSQRVLADLVNADDSPTGSFSSDRDRAADLVAAGRLYRRSAEAMGDIEMRDLLEDVERVLVDVANGPADGSSKDLTGVRTRISEQDLVPRLRLAMSEIRERERRSRPTW
jgi:hypothetical protein